MKSPGERPIPALPGRPLAPSDIPDIEQVAEIIHTARVLFDARHVDGHVLSLGQVLNGD